jgi:hypothetical protein
MDRRPFLLGAWIIGVLLFVGVILVAIWFFAEIR